ncbi:hypothetical protein [Roseovarius sp.]|uniref:hypothetical protein n=1 Tax=Roseovarius sp. TaxID=1486281 RepID=UPI003B5C2DDA
MSEEIIKDAEFMMSDGTTELNENDACDVVGATFRSVFGHKIVRKAYSHMLVAKGREKWSERDKEAAFPMAFAAAIAQYARQPNAQKLPGRPDEATARADYDEAVAFAKEYERETGVELIRKTASAHLRMSVQKDAKDFADTGVSFYTDETERVKQEYLTGQRDWSAAREKPVKLKSRGLAR